MSSTFECLPNELICGIFDYLPSIDACYAFYNLNKRFNMLLQHRTTQLDLSNCRISRFVFSCQNILPNIQNEFCLKLSMQRICTPIDSIFIQLTSPQIVRRLISLTLTEVNEQSWNIFLRYRNILINLHSLTIICNLYETAVDVFNTIMNTSMQSLTHFELGFTSGLRWSNVIIAAGEYLITMPNLQNMVLKVPVTINTLRKIIQALPKLVSINVILKYDSNDKIMKSSRIRNDISNLRKLIISACESYTFRDITELLQELPQLQIFWFTTCIYDNYHFQEYHMGLEWENLIRMYLPNLVDFRLNIGMERKMGQHPEDIIKQFCSPFWTQEKKWWFAAEKPDNNADTIELYSLPPPNDHKVNFRPGAKWASNSTNPNFNSIRIIGLQATPYESIELALIKVVHPELFRPQPMKIDRYFGKVNKICKPHDFDSGHFKCVTDIMNFIDITKIKILYTEDSNIFEILPLMINLTELEFHHHFSDVIPFANLSAEIPRLKRLIIKDWNRNYLGKDSLRQIVKSFPNLEFIEIGIKVLHELRILIAGLPNLTHGNIYLIADSIDENNIREILENKFPRITYTWSSEKAQITIWLN